MIKGMLEFLNGKKTIITGLVMVALGLLQTDQTLILEGLGLIFLRLGVKNIK
jgi:hypothetical protein|tara:strand:- start:1829 stop:1984 length:156 start_codon:yes stop_codon:yes gene_type:complete